MHLNLVFMQHLMFLFIMVDINSYSPINKFWKLFLQVTTTHITIIATAVYQTL